MSVQDFRTRLTGGGARPNQFRVQLSWPGGARPLGDVDTFLCEAASLPGQTIDVLPVMFRGREVKLAGERRFDPWQITIINDEGFLIHTALERWMNDINDIETNSSVSVNPNNYISQMNVFQLSRDNRVLKSYTFHNAWPMEITPISLSFGDNGNVSKFQANFAFDWFEPSTV